MPLIQRISRLFQADIHAVLDHIEEPHSLLKQAIREMESVVNDERFELETLRLDAEQLESHELGTRTSLDALAEELDLCFEHSEESLVRNLLRCKLEAERKLAALSERRQQIQHRIQALARSLDDHSNRLNAMQQKAELFEQEASSPLADSFSTVRDEEVEVAFLREKQRRAQS